MADLGALVVDLLVQAHAGGLQPGQEDPAASERQVLIEVGPHGLTFYPQAISTDTGEWDVPAHEDVRTLPQQVSVADIGRTVALAAEEAEDCRR